MQIVKVFDISISIERVFGVFRFLILVLLCAFCSFSNDTFANQSRYEPFVIKVVDSVSGNPIPLVELRTVNEALYYSDINGEIAYYEPGLMGEEVFFHIKSKLYEFPKDGFDYQGKAIKVVPNGNVILKLDKIKKSNSVVWYLDGVEGRIVKDISGSSRAMLLNGVSLSKVQGPSGSSGCAVLEFDGENDYVKLQRKIKDDFTISFWIKTAQKGSSGEFWFDGNGLIDADVEGFKDDFGVSLNGDKICFGTGNPDVSIFSRTVVNDNNWHHVVLTRKKDSGEINLYIDSIHEALGKAGKASLDSSKFMNIGRLITGKNPFKGLLSEIAILDYSVSRREIYSLYNRAFLPENKSIDAFVLKVVDKETGRSVPLVELVSDSGMQFYTDSAGVAAIYEPGFLNREVSFDVWSHGYEPLSSKDVKIAIKPGGTGTIKINRKNIAERLYRITGEGIYNESALAGLEMPLKNPLLSGKVLGQDTVAMVEYKGKLHWLWGDTNQPSYPLGNFKTSGGYSLIPGKGGLEPSEGVNLTYFVDSKGFSKQMYPRDDASLVWMNTMNTVGSGSDEKMIASYTVMVGGDANVTEQGFAIFNDSKEEYEKLVQYEREYNVRPTGMCTKHDGYIYVNCPYPTIRIKADLESVKNPLGYEAFSCLVEGSRYMGNKSKVDRDFDGKIVWAWKKNTSPLGDSAWDELVKAGLAKKDESWNYVNDVESGNRVMIAGGSAAYNPFKKRWVMVFGQKFGNPSFLGEIWYTEAENPEGPWTDAIKIVSHKNYTFYNVCLHPEFYLSGGRYVYFEGTYCETYSGNPVKTPKYNYNQMMYRLDLSGKELGSRFE